MVARLIEGWESSTTPSHYLGKWTAIAGTPVITSAAGRNGQGIRLATTSGAGFERTFDAQATWVVGFAFRYTSLASTYALCGFFDGAVAHCGLALNQADATLYAWRGVFNTSIGTSTGVVALNTWNYIEVKATIHDTAGVLVVKLNGATVLNLSSADTRNAGATATANKVRFGHTTSLSGTVFEYDDVYVFDATGASNTDFAGDCKVEQLAPTGAGATTAWTPSAGSNWQCVDEVPPTADTDYVSSATAGQTDTYACGNLATASGTVFAVQATALVRKDDAGSRSLALVARPGSTDRVGATQAVGDSYASVAEVWSTNPDTSAAWTISEVNAAAFGQRLIA